MKEIQRIFDLLDLYRDEYSAKEDVFGFKKHGKWRTLSAEHYTELSDKISYSILSMGLLPGDRVATIMNNIPEWNCLDMGILQAGCVHVPVYPLLSPGNYRFIFEDADVKLIVIGNADVYNRISEVIKMLSFKGQIVSLENIDGVISWQDFLEHGNTTPKEEILLTIKGQISPQNLATIIYTSGTTGDPKGVMLSHANLVSNFTTVSMILNGIEVQKALSFLPLCHVYERMLNYMYQYLGISVYYAENPDRIRDNLKDIRPDMFCAVPRVIEKSYAAILRKGKNLGGLRKLVFSSAIKFGFNFEIEKVRSPYYRMRLKIADILVFRKWRLAFGNNIRFIVSGGAALNPKLTRLFWAAGMKIIEGYGLTETSPVIATGNFEPDGIKFGTVGPVIQGVEVNFTAEGEILCRGANVMMGYFNQPEKTAEVIDEDGWFHTGDIGELIEGKYLKITDRKKEIFKTSGGKYIAPQIVENKLKESPFIENLLVIGERRNFPSALIVPNFEYLRSWCNDKGLIYTTDAEMIKTEVVISRINRDVSLLNMSLDHPSQIRKFALMDKEWTVQSGELSFTMKVRRTHLQEVFADVIEGLYHQPSEVHHKKKKKKKKK